MLSRFATYAGLALVAFTSAATAADRSADQILKEIDAGKVPAFDPSKREDRKAIEEYINAREEAMGKRGKLVLELFRVDPENDRLPGLFVERWRGIPPVGPEADSLLKEIGEVAAKVKNEKLQVEAATFQVSVLALQRPSKTAEALAALEGFAKAFPKHERTGQLLYTVVQTADKDKRPALEDRLIKEYPDSPYTGMVKGARRQREAIGKPFDLEFTDAISGKSFSRETLKGKVVVVDFWATWCGPCVGEMPTMKKLYSEYKDKGVEFVGVSLDSPEDEGGLKALKEFVAENHITWPQYYQGKGWESGFSSGWGITGIPTVFVVDAKGNLYSVEARGKLEEIIPELLKKKDAAPAGE